MSHKAQHQKQRTVSMPNEQKLFQWLQKFDREAIEFANEQGEMLRSVPSSQIRKIFGTLRELELQLRSGHSDSEWEAKLLMMKPRVAYLAGRHQSVRNAKLHLLVSSAVDLIVKAPDSQQQKMFLNFVRLFEAILAYFKYYGGK